MFLVPAVMAAGSYSYSMNINVGFFETFSPIADSGTYSGWTPSTGERWSCVDDNWIVANDTDYIYASTSGTKVAFSFDNWVGTATIDYVVVNTRAINVETGTVSPTSISLFHLQGATETEVATYTPTDTYGSFETTLTVNPATSGTWSTADIDAME